MEEGAETIKLLAIFLDFFVRIRIITKYSDINNRFMLQKASGKLANPLYNLQVEHTFLFLELIRTLLVFLKLLFFRFAKLLFQLVQRQVHGGEEFRILDCRKSVCNVFLFDRNAQGGLFPIRQVDQDFNSCNEVEITTKLLDLRFQMSLGLFADAAMSRGNCYVHIHLPFLLIAICGTINHSTQRVKIKIVPATK